ncbi:PIN domain-containing protein [bacterium]|nr:PIN domain-containing protein [bacterium]
MDKVLVDTSIWIEFFRGKENIRLVVENLLDNRLICCTGLIMGELLQGAKTEKEICVLKDFLDCFEFLPEKTEQWLQAGRLSFDLRRKGITVGLSDCFLAVLAVHHNVSIFTRDDHFRLMEKETNIKLYCP